MRISKKKWTALEKRVADLEALVQSQHDVNRIMEEFNRKMSKSYLPRHPKFENQSAWRGL